jgi:predicted DnaQ family exonuclease/DinG family helicase
MKTNELLKPLNLNEFISFDLETTGLNEKTDQIIEISAYRFVNGEPVDEFNSLINPEMSIPAFITDLTSISNEMVEDAPKIQNVLPKLLKFLGKTPIVGHNVNFDLTFIDENFKRHGIIFNYPNAIYDTVTLARMFLFFNNEFNLGAVSEYFGLSSKGSHRAGVDTYNTGKIFVELIKEAASYPIQIIQKIDNLMMPTSLPNKNLFSDIISYAIRTEEMNGIVKSEIVKTQKNVFYVHKSTHNKQELPESPREWLKKDGIVSQKWEGYEERESQIELSVDTSKAFEHKELLLAEAGTGSGKSLAYLTAGIHYRKKTDIPLVVSTHTKNLQDQLFYSDIPKIADVLNIDLSAILLKGRRNYLCKTRLQSVLNNSKSILSEYNVEHLLSILIWSEFTISGDISECNGFWMKNAFYLWSMIRSEPGFCTTNRCEKNDGCYLGKIRKQIPKSDIIIVNHALLFGELQQERSNLPDEFSYVIDEGHNFSHAAWDQLIHQIGDNAFDDIFTFLNTNNKHFKHELLLLKNDKQIIYNQLIEIEQDGIEHNKSLGKFFKSYNKNHPNYDPNQEYYEQKFIISSGKDEFNKIAPSPFDILMDLTEYSKTIQNFIKTLKEAELPVDNYMQELRIISMRFSELIITFQRLLLVEKKDIVWVTFTKKNRRIFTTFSVAPKDVGEYISNSILLKESGGLICSATLTVNNKFKFIKQSIGVHRIVDKKTIHEKNYYSPFHFEDQVQLYVHSSELNVNTKEYLDNIADQIYMLSKHIRKRMLVLCTSYSQVKSINSYLQARFSRSQNKIFAQLPGSNRRKIQQGYLENEGSILIGTSSFWEGVDLPGDKLEMLFIVKIPFANPKDPEVVAQIETFKSKGKNAFMEYQVPDATVKFKQGFGRLIRTLDDSGACFIGDPRLLNTRYGQIILDSLPMYQYKAYSKAQHIIDGVKTFLM